MILFNPAAIIAGAVRGAAEQILPSVSQDVVQTIRKAAEAPPAAPAPAPPPALDPDALARQLIDKVLADPQVAKMTTPIPWYQSQAIWGSVLAIAAPIATLAGYAVSAEDQAFYAQQLALIGGAAGSIVGGALMIYGRFTTTRPIGKAG